jgi:hypothetical protein
MLLYFKLPPGDFFGADGIKVPTQEEGMAMSLRAFSGVTAAAVLLVFATGCGPDKDAATTPNEASTSPATTEDTPPSSPTAMPTNTVSIAYPEDYICRQVTDEEASNALGESVTATPDLQPKGMALCVYNITEGAGFTIGYMSNATWYKHKDQADRHENGYRNQSDGSVITEGPLGSAYAALDDNGMMIYVQEQGVTKLIGKEKFNAFRKTLPSQIN